MWRSLWWSMSLAAWLLAQAPLRTGGGPTGLVIDAANSQVLIEVGKAGVFGFAGHAHEVAATDVRGEVIVDRGDLSRASVSLDFEAGALQVTGKGEPPADVAEVQRVMLSTRVLDAGRFPTVSFRSRRVSVTVRPAAAAELLIEGDLTLHGTTRPMTVRASAAFDSEGRLTARGSCSLLQSEFGIVPVTAAGGTVRVRDEVDIQFVLSAKPADGSRTAHRPA